MLAFVAKGAVVALHQALSASNRTKNPL
jgi:hypothetical protein